MPKSAKIASSTSHRVDPLGPRAGNVQRPARNSYNSRADDESDSFVFQVNMPETDKPSVTRLLVIPKLITFDKLHLVLQAAFGWGNCHRYTFEATKILKKGERPGWTGYGKRIIHMVEHSEYEDFARYGINGYELWKMSEHTLADIYESEEYRNRLSLQYTYDTGDNWMHELIFLGSAPPTLNAAIDIPETIKVVCLGGQGHPVAEDCGGAGGWERLKAQFSAKDGDAGLKDWYKKECANTDGKALDPYKWSIVGVNTALAHIELGL
ncbi:hypothetical protein P152DRAFT_459783 [Eremomyces bilateralis CBS 781.70]|uniref:Plasmid pRiA4b Orf3-like domain-containing protein n=1 Tax=Eremomyces bilateralis CBS 781.70 TaxID=1392243 RepID=A0A6G1FZV3_9PEZI|nr:uncharacterized protein P152DRAFT_459783 [Eremomyces bilateralis CBS 781.70]KAF1811387.1 hypothetical protein P152DRAFT_459783 [Eremomyces bilateralis CBS 781.70]